MINPEEIKNLFSAPYKPFAGEYWYFGHEFTNLPIQNRFVNSIKGKKMIIQMRPIFGFQQLKKYGLS